MWHEELAEEQRQYMTPIGDGIFAYVPPPLPTKGREWPGDVTRRLSVADRAFGELRGRCGMLGEGLIYAPMVRREALVSSEMEGTVASPEEVVVAGHTDASGDAREVLNYYGAMMRGIHRLEHIPVSTRLIKELHAVLMQGVRGERESPGEFRSIQVHLGETKTDPIERATYVPPPASKIDGCMNDLDRYINQPLDERSDPPLIRAALAHYQFEAIHPFRDGNGRIGRLLVPLALMAEKELPAPLLYISDYCARNKPEYLKLLHHTTVSGDPCPWVAFFLDAIAQSSRSAVRLADGFRDLREDFRERVRGLRRPSAHLMSLVDLLFSDDPSLTTARAREKLGLTARTAENSVNRLVELGILEETPWPGRGKLYSSGPILAFMIREG